MGDLVKKVIMWRILSIDGGFGQKNPDVGDTVKIAGFGQEIWSKGESFGKVLEAVILE